MGLSMDNTTHPSFITTNQDQNMRLHAPLPFSSTRHPSHSRSPSLATLATAPARCSWNRCVFWLVWSTTQKRAVGSEKYPIGCWLLLFALMIAAARVPTIQMINEYFGVAVIASHGWRSAGVEPWMGSSTDKQLPRSTTRATSHS